MLNHVSLFDDFTGYDVLAEIWNGDYYLGTYSERFITKEGTSDDLNGTLSVKAGDEEFDYLQVDMQHTNQFRRAKKATFEARFSLGSEYDIDVVLGFTVNDHTNVFGVHVNDTDGDFRIYSRVGTVDVINSSFPTPIPIDQNWHTVKVACNGDGDTVDIYFDGDFKGSISDANLPEGDITPHAWISTLAEASRILYIDWISVHQARAARVRYVDDIADSNVHCIGEGVDEYLVGMDTTGTDAGEAWSISADYTATSLGKPTGATRCEALSELNGDIYGGFNTATPDLHKWAGGTSWTAQSLSQDVFDIVKWADEMYIGTSESSGRATVQKFDNPGWTDIGSSSWTNESNTAVRMCVHDNKLYAIYLSDNEVFEYVSGTTWTSRGNPGGVTTATLGRARSIFTFKGGLYAASGATDSVIYRWGGGTTWTAVYTASDALQRPVVSNGQIVVFDRNTTTGEITVFTSPDGERFTEVDSFTPSTNADVATGRARGAVVVGLTSTDAKIWEVR